MLAWLQATPVSEQDQAKTLSQRKRAEAPSVTRLELLAEKGVEPELPDLSCGHYLVDYLMEAGPVSPGGMGAVPLSWADLVAWSSSTGITLAPWEARMLRRLSAEYLDQSRKAEKLDCPSPAHKPLSDESRAAVAAQLESALDALIQTRPGT